MNHTGKCLCGKVSFTVEDMDPHIHACHCTMCRTWAGAPLMAVSVSKLTFSDETQISRYRSSEWAERGFCTTCGTNLFYHLIEQDHYIVCSGALEDQTTLELTGEIFIDEKPGFYELAGDHPRLTGEEFLASMQMTPSDSV